MKKETKNKVIVLAAVAAIATYGFASPLSLPIKAVILGAEKVGLRVCGHAAGKAAARGGAALAKASAKHEAAKAVVVGAERSGAKVAGHAAEGAAARGGSALAAATAARESGGALAKVSGKQIAALGIATAAVVGTHEVADGAQDLLAGVGECARNDPQVATTVADGILLLPRALTLAILALLVWFVWPFIMTARNAIRLVVARRARTHEAVSPASPVPPIAPTVPPAAQAGAEVEHGDSAGFVRIRTLVAMSGLGLIAVLGLTGVVCGDDDGRADVPPDVAAEAKDAAEDARAKRAETVARLRNEYNVTVDKAFQAFVAEVDAVSKSEFGRVRDGIPGVVGQYGAILRCCSFVKSLVYDKMTGEKSTEESIMQDLEVQFYSGLYEARDRVLACVKRLSSTLEAARNGFALGVVEELASADMPGDGEYRTMLEVFAARIEESKRNLTKGQIEATAACVVEAIFIRESVAAVSKLLGALAARVAGTVATSLGAALLDGPIPLLDLIGAAATVACLVWSISEVRAAAKVLPREMAEALGHATRECEQHCREEVLKAGATMVVQYKVGE